MRSLSVFGLLSLLQVTTLAAPFEEKPKMCKTPHLASYDNIHTNTINGLGYIPAKGYGSLHYDGLLVASLSRLNAFAQPQSPPNSIFFNNFAPEPHTITPAPGITSFDPTSIRYMCVAIVAGLQAGVPCSIDAVGVTTTGQNVSTTFTYTPTQPLLNPSVMHLGAFPAEFKQLTALSFALSNADLAVLTSVELDNFKYVTHKRC